MPSTTQPSIPKGTRDFGPAQMARRQYVFDKIRRHFELFGFQPLETPAMENLAVLTGKYGEEGDRLIYKILNSGNFAEGLTADDLAKTPAALAAQLCDRALRYDLTVPFARYVVANRGTLAFPFRRYQMQPVWRADRPQRGRYREFWQCDADIVGTDSLVCEAELVALLYQVFTALGLDVVVKINSRKLLTAIGERFVEGTHLSTESFITILDKLDKIGPDGVKKELLEAGLSANNAKEALNFLQVVDALSAIQTSLAQNTMAQSGIAEIEQVHTMAQALGVPASVIQIDITLARGLNYYTGAILEVKANGIQMGSIAGGGRYDNLTGVFGVEGLSGVGISFGIDRICDVLEELNLYPADLKAGKTKALICVLDESLLSQGLALLANLRAAGIASELYPEATKLKKQLGHADKLGVRYALLLGSEEAATQSVMLKDLLTGQQEKVAQNIVASHIAEIS